jgi:60 kDa SS-A/Ro ribonucleoprotein
MANYAKYFRKDRTPQTEPIPGSHQVRNSAGGYSFPVDDWTRLRRFLILGSEGGSYYASERALTVENAKAIQQLANSAGTAVVEEIVKVSNAGRAPKNDPAIFVLALCAASTDAAIRKAALAALPTVCRTGTHLFHFAEYVKAFRGWGRGLREAFAHWYNEKPAEELAYQAIKYQQRDGWSHRDLLRKAHPNAPSEAHNAVYKWIVDGWNAEVHGDASAASTTDAALQRIAAFEEAKSAANARQIVALIRNYDLPRECIPTEFLTDAGVWEALLERMPMTAMIRNLATMTRVDLIAPHSEAARKVTKELGSMERLRRARVHPIAVLSALKTYAQGHGERGKATWHPVTQIVDALDSAFYASFGNVKPTRKRITLALDVSGSMGWGNMAGAPGLTPRDASAALALVTAAVEPEHRFVVFAQKLVPLKISPRQRLDDVVRHISNIPFGGTDCALPMVDALKSRTPVDAFVVLTDSETWFGDIHPVQALQQYRQRMEIPARLAVVGMVANRFSIADPADAGMMDVVGFDTATPQLLSDFIAGSV